jgi:hypothetical protein
MNLEEQIKAHKELSLTIEELERQKKALGLAIMQQMQSKTLRVGNYLVKKFMRLSIKLSLQEARTLNAIKLEENIDRDKIRELYEQGDPIQGISEVHYIQITTTCNQI